MKALTLTEEHKSKLLEMCNVLFPNILDVPDKMDKDLNLNTTFIDIREEVYLNEGTPDEEYVSNDYSIHWFEFCMTHLVEKIIAVYIINKDGNKIYKRTLNDDLSKFYLESLNFSRGYNKQHPIDYLYTEFKKIKN